MDKFTIFDLFNEADDDLDLEEPKTAPEMNEEPPTEDTPEDKLDDTTDGEDNTEDTPNKDTPEDKPDDNNDEEETADDNTDGEETPEEPVEEVDPVEVKNKEKLFNLFNSSSILISDLKERISNIKDNSSDLEDNEKNEMNKLVLFIFNELDETKLLIDDIILTKIKVMEYDVLKQIYMKIIGKIEFITKLFEQINK